MLLRSSFLAGFPYLCTCGSNGWIYVSIWEGIYVFSWGSALTWQIEKASFIIAKYLHRPAICSYRCVVLLPYLWQDNQVGKQFEQTHEKTPEKEKKASLRSQGGGFTPQSDNTRQTLLRIRSHDSWFSTVKRRTCATGLTGCVWVLRQRVSEKLIHALLMAQLMCTLLVSILFSYFRSSFLYGCWFYLLICVNVQNGSPTI